MDLLLANFYSDKTAVHADPDVGAADDDVYSDVE